MVSMSLFQYNNLIYKFSMFRPTIPEVKAMHSFVPGLKVFLAIS